MEVDATATSNTIWILVCTVLVFGMQAGFCCLESGLVRAKNSIHVAAKNVVDMSLAAMVFWLVGYGLMFGADQSGLVGTSGFFFGAAASPGELAFFVFQVAFCGTAVTIISGAVAERMRFSGYLVIAGVTSAVVYPIVGHWAWGGTLATSATGWLEAAGFIDFAGSSVVHSVGGWVALAAILQIGPRLGRFGEGGRPIQGHDMPLAVLGTLLLWFGWFGFNGGSLLGATDAAPLVFTNTLLSGAAGGLASLAVSWRAQGVPRVEHIAMGVLAGLVAVTASCNAITPAAAATAGAIGGVLCFGTAALLERLHIDDAIGAVPVHLVPGIWGTVVVALFGDAAVLGTGLDTLGQLRIQLIGIFAIGTYTFATSAVLLRLVDTVLPLRVSAENERQGLNFAEHLATTELADLLDEMEGHRQTGDFGTPVSIEPHTEVGQIAGEYNRVLDRVNRERGKLADSNEQLESSNADLVAMSGRERKARERLEETVDELENFNRLVSNRELRMIELKREVNDVLERHEESARYDLSFDGTPPGKKDG